MDVPEPKRSPAGAKSKLARNSAWLAEIEAGQATVRQIAERESLTQHAVRAALKLARNVKKLPPQ